MFYSTSPTKINQHWSLGGGQRAAFKKNIWIICWSTKNVALCQQVLSEIVVSRGGVGGAPITLKLKKISR